MHLCMCTHVSNVVHKYTFKYKYFHKNRDEHRHKCTLIQKKRYFSETGDVCSSSIFALASATSHQSCGNCTRGVTQQMNQNLKETLSNCLFCAGDLLKPSHINSSGISGTKHDHRHLNNFNDIPPSRR